MNKSSIVLILALVLLTSCGKAVVVDPEFPKYLKRFEVDAAAHGVNVSTAGVSVSLRDQNELPYTAIGQCSIDLGVAEIEISRKFWNNATEYGRRQLLYHELGHCVLHRDHVEFRLQLNVPASIMYPKNFSDEVFIKYERYYIDELFSTRDTWL